MATMPKLEGEITSTQKQPLSELFKNEFRRNDQQAADMLLVVTHLLGKCDEIKQHPEKILECSKSRFSEEQLVSAARLVEFSDN